MGVPAFACTSCGWCCRNLVESGLRALPADWPALARQGLYPLPRVGGLQVWPWERRRLLARAPGMRFRPALAAVVEGGGGEGFAAGRGLRSVEAVTSVEAVDGTEAVEAVEAFAGTEGFPARAAPLAVVLLWEYEGKECALVTPDQRCSVYAERPVVCRAFPLLLAGTAVAVSGRCPGAVVPGRAEDLLAAYGPSHGAARAAATFPSLVGAYLGFVEGAGRVRLRRDLAPADAQQLVVGGRAVDLLDLLEAEGVATQADVEARCATLGVAYG